MRSYTLKPHEERTASDVAGCLRGPICVEFKEGNLWEIHSNQFSLSVAVALMPGRHTSVDRCHTGPNLVKPFKFGSVQPSVWRPSN